jgi:methyl-accepting chemotaxis protein
MEYVTLMGAEEVGRAASRIASAAQDLQRAADTIAEAASRIQRAVEEAGHLLDRLEARSAQEKGGGDGA